MDEQRPITAAASEWNEDMAACLGGRKCLLLTAGQVAVIGALSGDDRSGYIAWAPLPRIRKKERPLASVFDDHKKFMLACGQTVDANNTEQRALYLRLIEEEFGELMDANNEVDAADAVIDIMVVLIGYGLSCGWPMQRLWDEVLASNLAKIDPATGKVSRREDGKVLKPEGWRPPDIGRVLREHRAAP